MKTKKELLAEIKASKSDWVTYGESDLGTPIKREDAILDITGMEEEMIGLGTWYECDNEGNIID